MSDFLDNILRMDRSGNHLGINNYINANRGSPDIVHDIYMSLISSRVFEAYVLSKILVAGGINHAIVSLGQCLGGFLYGDRNDEAQGIGSLAAQMDGLTVDQQAILSRNVVHK